MSAPRCFQCGALAVVYAETPMADFPMCRSCFDAGIASSQRHTPEMDPELVRQCMERASHPVVTVLPALCSLCTQPLEDDDRDERWHTAHSWCADVERDAMRGDALCDAARDRELMRGWGAKS